MFDQLPRTLLTLAAVVGGIVVPGILRIRGRRLESGRMDYWIWPTGVCFPACLLAILVTLPGKVDHLIGIDVSQRFAFLGGETKECLLGAFMAMYLWSLHRRLREREEPAADVLPWDARRAHAAPRAARRYRDAA